MDRLSEDEVRLIRLKVSTLEDGRCRTVDDDGCRCLCRPHGHKSGHDFPWTRWTDVAAAARARVALGKYGLQP